MTRLLPFLAVLLLATVPVSRARAAQGFDSCTGFIESLPATIGTPGTWCLRGNLSTTLATGVAITITADNVAIDCNHFRFENKLTDPTRQAVGIFADSQRNLAVRRCSIGGFLDGIALHGIAETGSHVIEDNRLDHNTYRGIYVVGNGSVIRRNIVLDTGGSTDYMASLAKGIQVLGNADILDNTVAGVAPILGPYYANTAFGIDMLNNSGGTVSGNRIRGLVPLGDGRTYAINAHGGGAQSIHDNEIVGDRTQIGTGITCLGGDSAMLVTHNVVIDYWGGLFNCKNIDNVFVVPPST